MRAWNWNATDSKKLFLTWLLPDISRYDSPKKCTTILYAVNLWLKPVSATGAGLLLYTVPLNDGLAEFATWSSPANTRHVMLNQCWVKSMTLAQHWSNIESMSCVCWERIDPSWLVADTLTYMQPGAPPSSQGVMSGMRCVRRLNYLFLFFIHLKLENLLNDEKMGLSNRKLQVANWMKWASITNSFYNFRLQFIIIIMKHAWKKNGVALTLSVRLYTSESDV